MGKRGKKCRPPTPTVNEHFSRMFSLVSLLAFCVYTMHPLPIIQLVKIDSGHLNSFIWCQNSTQRNCMCAFCCIVWWFLPLHCMQMVIKPKETRQRKQRQQNRNTIETIKLSAKMWSAPIASEDQTKAIQTTKSDEKCWMLCVREHLSSIHCYKTYYFLHLLGVLIVSLNRSLALSL